MNEITAVCSGGEGAENAPHKVMIPNPDGKRFDEVDLSTMKCPECGKTGTLQAMPM